MAEHDPPPDSVIGAAGVSPGDIIADKYLLDAVLGVGGMGVVFRARHLHLNGQVALSSCAWEAWGAWGQCTGVTATCTPGASESRSVGCPCSDNKTQKRTCSSSCAWGDWSDTTSCELACCSEIVDCNTPDDISPASRGTWCRRTDPDCSNAQVDSDCLADVAAVCGPVVPQLYIQY